MGANPAHHVQSKIVVIGGSAGSIEATKVILNGLPGNFRAPIFLVVHVSADSPSMLAEILSNAGALPAEYPMDGEKIGPGRVYVAPPDKHLTIEDDRVRVLRGPRENRHRPAIDPLFRSAARAYGPRVIGIVLSGFGDDGSAGLYAVKRRGGIAVVEAPDDSPWKEMPQNAIEYASPEYVWRTQEIASNLIKVIERNEGEQMNTKKNLKGKKKIREPRKGATAAASDVEGPERNMEVAYPDEGQGVPSVFACPECHGVLWELNGEHKKRFRCRVGHSYGTDSLTEELSMASENALWAAVRALEEKAAMQRRVAEGISRGTKMSTRMLDQSAADAANARLIRDMIFRRDAELERMELLERKAS